MKKVILVQRNEPGSDNGVNEGKLAGWGSSSIGDAVLFIFGIH